MRVEVEMATTATGAVIAVTDAGPGLRSEERDRVDVPATRAGLEVTVSLSRLAA